MHVGPSNGDGQIERSLEGCYRRLKKDLPTYAKVTHLPVLNGLRITGKKYLPRTGPKVSIAGLFQFARSR